jgi:hypothetical protein
LKVATLTRSQGSHSNAKNKPPAILGNDAGISFTQQLRSTTGVRAKATICLSNIEMLKAGFDASGVGDPWALPLD